MAADKALVANLLHINGLDEYKPFRDWLKEKREFWRDATEAQQDTALYRAQGRAQMLKVIFVCAINPPYKIFA